jgi:hypothetical protein
MCVSVNLWRANLFFSHIVLLTCVLKVSLAMLTKFWCFYFDLLFPLIK